MKYNNRHQTPDTRHQRWQSDLLNISKKRINRVCKSSFVFIPNVFRQQVKNYHQYSLSSLFFLILQKLSKLPLTWLFLLLTYSFHSQALSTNTVNTIQGSQPYLTFDGGNTKVTTAEGLFDIKLSNGTTITPATNTSTVINPIVLPTAGQSFANIDMFVPANTDSIALTTLIGSPNNYWGDDDGDGQGVNGITATGSLSVNITDKENQAVSRNTVLNICNAPYKVVLSSTNGVLSTQYGDPNKTTFNASNATYYISPKSPPVICYAKPNLEGGKDMYAGPKDIWDPNKGFLLQSIEPASYGRNFPTTGANKLYFDLNIGMVGAGPTIWPAVTRGGITATMTPTPEVTDGTSIRVTLTGPVATASQINSSTPSLVSKPNLPQQFELVGYDSNNSVVVKYGFVLKQWFVNRGNVEDNNYNQTTWCANSGYRLAQVKDLTNSLCTGLWAGDWCQGMVGATPSSTGNHYKRNIGAGFFTEWGFMGQYPEAGFYWRNYWTSDSTPRDGHFYVDEDDADVYDASWPYILKVTSHAVCAYP